MIENVEIQPCNVEIQPCNVEIQPCNVETQSCRICNVDKPKTEYYKYFRVCKKCTIEKNMKKLKDGGEYSCDLCIYKTNSEVLYIKHLETKKHIIKKSLGIFTYGCNICNFSSMTIKGLTQHAKTESHINLIKTEVHIKNN